MPGTTEHRHTVVVGRGKDAEAVVMVPDGIYLKKFNEAKVLREEARRLVAEVKRLKALEQSQRSGRDSTSHVSSRSKGRRGALGSRRNNRSPLGVSPLGVDSPPDSMQSQLSPGVSPGVSPHMSPPAEEVSPESSPPLSAPHHEILGYGHRALSSAEGPLLDTEPLLDTGGVGGMEEDFSDSEKEEEVWTSRPDQAVSLGGSLEGPAHLAHCTATLFAAVSRWVSSSLTQAMHCDVALKHGNAVVLQGLLSRHLWVSRLYSAATMARATQRRQGLDQWLLADALAIAREELGRLVAVNMKISLDLAEHTMRDAEHPDALRTHADQEESLRMEREHRQELEKELVLARQQPVSEFGGSRGDGGLQAVDSGQDNTPDRLQKRRQSTFRADQVAAFMLDDADQPGLEHAGANYSH
jgi:hypothetical protein